MRSGSGALSTRGTNLVLLMNKMLHMNYAFHVELGKTHLSTQIIDAIKRCNVGLV